MLSGDLTFEGWTSVALRDHMAVAVRTGSNLANADTSVGKVDLGTWKLVISPSTA
jgi:hypothetical protein